MIEGVFQREIHGGRVIKETEEVYRLFLPELNAGTYGLSQLDNYSHLARQKFPYYPPIALQIEAKAGGKDLRGTWGFGLWNDPFSAGFGAGGMSKWLPVLPNAAWFFFASPPNQLSLRSNLPGSGFHLKTFRSALLPSFLSLLAIPAAPLLFWKVTARIIRRFVKVFIQEAAFSPEIDVDDWHRFQIIWAADKVDFLIDDGETFTTSISPCGRLGLVIWIDNQYFYWNPKGKPGFGSLSTYKDQAIFIRNLNISQIE